MRMLALLALLVVGCGSPAQSTERGIRCEERLGGCHCDADDSMPNNFACSPASVGNAMCCAYDGYPNKTWCECTAPFGCETFEPDGGALCIFGTDDIVKPTVDSYHPKAGERCCRSTQTASTIVCSCGKDPCSSLEVEVSACTVDLMECQNYSGSAQNRVSSCSQ